MQIAKLHNRSRSAVSSGECIFDRLFFFSFCRLYHRRRCCHRHQVDVVRREKIVYCWLQQLWALITFYNWFDQIKKCWMLHRRALLKRRVIAWSQSNNIQIASQRWFQLNWNFDSSSACPQQQRIAFKWMSMIFWSTISDHRREQMIINHWRLSFGRHVEWKMACEMACMMINVTALRALHSRRLYRQPWNGPIKISLRDEFVPEKCSRTFRLKTFYRLLPTKI